MNRDSIQKLAKPSILRDRLELLPAWKDMISAHREQLAQCAVDHVRIPVSDALNEIDRCTWLANYLLNEIERMLQAEVRIAPSGRQTLRAIQPMGTVLAVMPWNMPFWKIVRSTLSTWLTGNNVIVKPAGRGFECAKKLEEIFRLTGIPESEFSVQIISHDKGEDMLTYCEVDGLSFTGSTPAGLKLASIAKRQGIHSILEMGGNDAYIVAADADLETAAHTLVRERMSYAGQRCISPKRMIVERAVYPRFTEQVIAELSEMKLGIPEDPKTEIGPLPDKNRVDRMDGFVTESVKQGAHLAYRMPTDGLPDSEPFFAPVVLTDCSETMLPQSREFFGPIVSLFPADDLDGAIALANANSQTLGGGIFTQRAESDLIGILTALKSSMLAVNNVVEAIPEIPFGGRGTSGSGRELGKTGLLAFLEERSIWLS